MNDIDSGKTSTLSVCTGMRISSYTDRDVTDVYVTVCECMYVYIHANTDEHVYIYTYTRNKSMHARMRRTHSAHNMSVCT